MMKRIRILIAKPGLDGHDRGAHVVAMALRDAGMEVIYSGLHQTIPAIIKMALEEDVDIIGLSILSGAHLALTRKFMDALESEGLADKPVVLGGTIPPNDTAILKELGVRALFPAGTPLTSISQAIQDLIESHDE